MKKVLAIFVAMLLSGTSFACEVCEKRQPKFFKGITHGTGPDSNWDYLFVWATVLIVLVTLYYSIKYLVSPKEENASHIKTMILD